MDHEVDLTEQIIGCAIEVHRALGPGLLESAYKRALGIEFAHRNIRFARERKVPLRYRDRALGDYKVDLIVEDRVVVEVKSVMHLEPVFEAQVRGGPDAGIKRFVL